MIKVLMMGVPFWVKRFLQVFVGMFILIAVAQWFKTNALDYALTQAAIWGTVSATVYMVFLYRKLKQNPTCAIAYTKDDDKK